MSARNTSVICAFDSAKSSPDDDARAGERRELPVRRYPALGARMFARGRIPERRRVVAGHRYLRVRLGRRSASAPEEADPLATELSAFRGQSAFGSTEPVNRAALRRRPTPFLENPRSIG